jgi:tetratricopeptide (TPR) repeat protein
MAEVNGKKTPVIDSVALTRFAQQHQLPDIPDLTRFSWEAAPDIHNALAGVAAHPGDAAALGQRERVFQSHQYPAKALACYSQARALAPSAFEWAYYSVRIHAEVFEFGPAIEAYERAAELNSDYASTFLALGNLYLQSGDGDKAVTKAQRLLILQRYSEALDVLDWLVAKNPDSFDGHYNRGAAQVMAGQYLAAVKSFRKAVRLKEGSARAHVALAEALGQTDQHAEATDEYRRALELDPANARAIQQLRASEQ